MAVLAPVVIPTSIRRCSRCDMLGEGIACKGKASPVALPTEGERTMFATICRALRRRAAASLCAAGQRLLAWLKPATGAPVAGALGDLARTKAELLAESALLRQQLVVRRRQVGRPRLTPAERLRLILLARLARSWRAALLI